MEGKKVISILVIVAVASILGLLKVVFWQGERISDLKDEVKTLQTNLEAERDFREEANTFYKNLEEINKDYENQIINLSNDNLTIRLRGEDMLRASEANCSDVGRIRETNRILQQDILNHQREVRRCEEIINQWRIWYKTYIEEKFNG